MVLGVPGTQLWSSITMLTGPSLPAPGPYSNTLIVPYGPGDCPSLILSLILEGARCPHSVYSSLYKGAEPSLRSTLPQAQGQPFLKPSSSPAGQNPD